MKKYSEPSDSKSRTESWSYRDSAATEEDEMQEKVTVNPVINLKVPNQLTETRKKFRHRISHSIIEADIAAPSYFNFRRSPALKSDAILPRPPKSITSKPKDKNRVPSISKLNTQVNIQKSKLARTDGVSIELSRVRQERKGDIGSKYEVLYTLGKGSYGEVQKISDLETGEIKAAKIVSKKKCLAVDKYSDEIEILKKLVTSSTLTFRITPTCSACLSFTRTPATTT